jgi:hypothetical protein
MLPYLDFLFIAACLTLGFGVSLATYRIFALRNDWPMGELHLNKPLVPIRLGVFSMVIAFLFAAARQAAPDGGLDGWWIVICGFLWGFLWTGMMRVGSQISLFLAPLATLILMLAWIGVRTPPGYISESRFVPNVWVPRVPLPERAPRVRGSGERRLAQEIRFTFDGDYPER